MALKVYKLSAERLRLGMYVSKLDRPWLETPFLMQGFLVKSQEQIRELQKFCQFLYIDEQLSESVGGTADHFKRSSTLRDKTAASSRASSFNPNKKYSREDLKKLFPNKSLRVYGSQSELHHELIPAKKIFSELSASVNHMMNDIRQGDRIDIAVFKTAVNPMVSSIIRNPDACIWLARMKSRDSYTYKHSMGASVWAVALGRQIGLPQADLKTLAIATLLCDIGKLKLPSELIEKAGELEGDELAVIQSHVALSLEALNNTAGISEEVYDIVAAHHERFNGQGYPKGLRGNDIAVMARIAAIADSYDAMTSQRVYSNAKSPVVAVKELYELRGKAYQPELIEEFIQAVGLYPAGTLVELSSGEIAVVVSENKMRRLRPKILKLLDPDKKPIKAACIVDLSNNEQDDAGDELNISQSLEPGSFGINPEAIYF
ncbi:MAG: diguanylate cyclase [Gammaproteobacteria bacterium]|nr:MAG: diguanylate cyclase [Gammaproteobacteria bacterium]